MGSGPGVSCAVTLNTSLTPEQRARFQDVAQINHLLDASKTILPLLTIEDCRRLIAEGIATGGMQAKLDAATSAVSNGVAEVRIVRGSDARIVSRVFAGEGAGSRIVGGAN